MVFLTVKTTVQHYPRIQNYRYRGTTYTEGWLLDNKGIFHCIEDQVPLTPAYSRVNCILFICRVLNLGLLSIWKNKLVLEAHFLNQGFRNIQKVKVPFYNPLKLMLFSPYQRHGQYHSSQWYQLTFFRPLYVPVFVIIKCFTSILNLYNDSEGNSITPNGMEWELRRIKYLAQD